MAYKEWIFIPGNVPSSKNSKQWTGKYLVHSKTAARYIKNTGILYKANKQYFKQMVEGIEPPYTVSFKFYRGSRRKFDYINAAQIVQDLMVKYEWIEDDNCEFLIPYFEVYEYDKVNPGVEIRVINNY